MNLIQESLHEWKLYRLYYRNVGDNNYYPFGIYSSEEFSCLNLDA